MSDNERFFDIFGAAESDSSEARKTVLYDNGTTNGVVWRVPPGTEVPAHLHPGTDDVWIILGGTGEYYLGGGEVRAIRAGMMAVAPKGKVHGVRATGTEPLIFAAVSAPVPAEVEWVKG